MGTRRLTKRELGELTGGTPPFTTSYAEEFALDKLGNWDEYDYGATSQTRAHNDDNQLTAIVQGGNTSVPTCDGAGNMTPHPDIGSRSAKYTLTYDAWNRLVKVTEPGSPSGVDVGQYEYDGLFRRVVKKYGSGLSSERYFLYSANWQVLEERTSPGGTADKRYVWGLRYLDDLVLRDRSSGGTLNERCTRCTTTTM